MTRTAGIARVLPTLLTWSAGSQPFNYNGGSGPYLGGVNGGSISPFNTVNVIATSLDFVTQASTYAGTSEPIGPSYNAPGLPATSAAIVNARDKFQNIDLDFDYPVGLIAITDLAGENISSPNAFVNGVLNLDGLRYSVVGDGTLRVIVNGVDSSNPLGAIPGGLVNVVNVTATIATNGVLTSPNIKGGSVYAVLFGVTFTPDNNSQTNAEPSLNKFIFTFDKPYETNPGGISNQIFKNFNVTESNAGSYSGSTTVTLSGATIIKGATAATALLGAGYYDQIIVDWGITSRKLHNPLTGAAVPLSYFRQHQQSEG